MVEKFEIKGAVRLINDSFNTICNIYGKMRI